VAVRRQWFVRDGAHTFTGTFQVNSAFTVPFEPFARCLVTISSWNQIAALYELII
jgi:hypothetical protein